MNFSSLRLSIILLVMTLSHLYCPGQISQQVSYRSIPHYFQFDTKSVLDQQVSLRSKGPIQIFLPMPSGNEMAFLAEENEVLSQEMKSKYPLIRSFDIRAVDNPKLFGKLTIGNNKVFATINSPAGVITIGPSEQRRNWMISYLGDQHPENKSVVQHNCELDQNEFRVFGMPRRTQLRSSSGFTNGSTKRTYRMAIVATGEFYESNGDNDTDVLAAITFAVNGLNLIYEKELAISFTIANTPRLYDDSATDPFIPDNAGGLARTNQAAIQVAANFASEDYDLGHVLHHTNSGDNWSTGGLAGLGVVCSESPIFTGLNKGRGWSGSSNNTTNSWIQLFAHEVGHMFSATHTFNGTGDDCNSSNIEPSTSYEIGSGTTIMSYQGLCQDNNNIPASGKADNYFHANSLAQMLSYINTNPVGSACATESNGENDEPIVDANPSSTNYTIPASTPFELIGSAEDLNQDGLSYCWEQFDEDGESSTSTQGLLGAAAGANASAPLFRSFPPSYSPVRVFPSLHHILDGDNTGRTFEALPSVDRTLNFALTVRDNVAGGGATACDLLSINVVNTGNSFEVLTQNSSTSLSADGTSTFTIDWRVAGTTGSGINCANVDILFSTDGGVNFSYILASSTANDGSHTVLIPNLPTTKGRIKVKGTDHIFFDINDADITINSSCTAPFSTILPKDDCVAAVGDASLDLSLSPNYGMQTTYFSGFLDNTDPTTPRPNFHVDGSGCVISNFANAYYETYTIQVTESGAYTFAQTEGFKNITIYENSFSTGNVCNNFLTTNTTYDPVSTNFFVATDLCADLVAGSTYIVLVTSVNQSFSLGQGDYFINVFGPGEIHQLGATPGAGLDYTYLIVDESTGDIVEFDDDPDLSNSVDYPAGCYTVYGLSFETSGLSTTDLNNTYANTSFASFQTLTIDQSICAHLSTNSKEVVLLGCGAEGAVIGPAATINEYEGSSPLDISLNPPDYTGLSIPGAGFDYTYMIINTADLKVVAFQDDPDLSNSGNFPAGSYLIYGLSYSTAGSQTSATLFSTYGNQSWVVLKNDLLDKSLCADTSSNNIKVNIIECLAEGSTFSPGEAFGANPGDASLDLMLSPDYGSVINEFSGDIQDDDLFSIDLAFSSEGSCDDTNDSYYESHTFYVSESGNYLFNMNAPFGQVLNIYDGDYDPNNVCTNWVASSAVRDEASGPIPLNSFVNTSLMKGVKYTLLIQTFNTSNPSYLGNYLITMAGPGEVVLDNLADPGANYQYTYLIVDESNGNIEEVTDDPDMSNSTNYPIGQYLIYGLSYEKTISGFTTAALNTNLVGTSFNDFRASLSSPDTCADLSTNSKAIVILDCDAEAGAITASDTVRAYQGDGDLNLIMMPDYTGTSDPGMAFSYAYIIASKTTGKIIEILNSPDLSNGGIYGRDTFHIYGISFANDTLSSTQLNTTYQGEDFTRLDSLINAKFICADLSSNTRAVVILPCEPNGTTFTPSTNLTAEANDPSLALTMSPVYGNLISEFSGELTNGDDQISLAGVNSLGGCSSFIDMPYYDLYSFQVNSSGEYTFTQSSSTTKVLTIYSDIPNENAGCNDFVSSSFFTATGLRTEVVVELQAYTTYYLVVNNFIPSSTFRLGMYTVTVEGPGQTYEDNPNPGTNYNYTYLVVQNSSSEIVQISPNPDLSDGTEFPIGNFTVYGFSYENSLIDETTLVNDYVDESLTSLQNAIAANEICGQLSSNTRALTITNSNLPVELLTFDLENLPNSVQLNWATSSESQNKGFYVERSEDGVQWQSLGFVVGAGNSQIRQEYQFVDQNPNSGVSFYRLQQVDLDGTYAYSQILSVDRPEIMGGFRLFPNPSNGVFNYQIGEIPENGRIIITNQLGQLIQVIRPANARDKIDLSKEKAGVYFFTFESEQGARTLRAVKLN